MEKTIAHQEMMRRYEPEILKTKKKVIDNEFLTRYEDEASFSEYYKKGGSIHGEATHEQKERWRKAKELDRI